MSRPERQQNVLDLLEGLRGIEPLKQLKQLFWSELNYQRVNQPLHRRGWTESASKALADDPVLFAGGGEDEAFHVIYCRLASDALARGFERPVVTQLLREHPYALFVFSNKGQTDWHFLNVKFDDQVERRRLFRRITVRPGTGLRTATERVQLLDLAEIHPELFGITPLAIQQRCDAAFDVEAVTKDFFSEIANWYFWALKNASFPKDAPKEDDGHDHISIIRLITRLIFCWFVKEKGLIPDTLFDERKLAQTLTGFEPAKTSDKESVFYKAILQNLFFATLNTEMDKRAWRKDDNNFMAHILYRHRALFQKPNEALELFKNIPFLNGGLFECLDKREGTTESPRDIRIDGFSDRSDSQPTVPDFLFFGGEREVDLSADYGDTKFRRVPVRGLIHIFNRYNFTVEENTPIEQEVALDPELSGKVFENLLAAYNPETGATARKQTGSFYTPREIVNYMVDESLIACLKTKLETALPSAKDVEARLRHLFAYDDEPHRFTAPEVDALIAAIDSLKSLDPAVGSGAFPMGILHKLVFILGKLDSRNEKWKERQIQRVQNTIKEAEKTEDAPRREKMVSDLEQQIAGINEAFEHNELDYGRKLYLIENCIYGVDIQPIAVQIAKMRFFISLIVDQKIDDAQPNRGVRPLPNLETKFVAANTLIGVNRPGQQLLRNRDIDAKEAELHRVRERHFLARTPKQKAKCRDDDARLRAEIAELLKNDGWDTNTARKLAAWNPYDQNISADFFDAEWMFGITDGFDVVMGNPPYVSYYSRHSQQIDSGYLKYLISRFRFSREPLSGKRYHSAMFFLEEAECLASAEGTVTFIVDMNIFEDAFAGIRQYLLKRNRITSIVKGLSHFENVNSGQVVLEFAKAAPVRNHSFWLKDGLDGVSVAVSQEACLADKSCRFVLPKVQDFAECVPLSEIGIVNTGVNIGGASEVFLSAERNSKDFLPFISTTTLKGKYQPIRHDGNYIHFSQHVVEEVNENNRKRGSKNVVVLGNIDRFKGEKLLIRQSAPEIVATYDEQVSVAPYSIFVLKLKPEQARAFRLKFILAVLNSKFATHYAIKNQIIRMGEGKQPQIRKAGLDNIPIKRVSLDEQKPFVDAVDRILDAKNKNLNADTTTLEHQIDQQIYALYGLTPAEIKIVEGAK